MSSHTFRTVVLFLLATSLVTSRLNNVAVREAQEFQRRMNVAVARGPEAVQSLVETRLAYIKCIGDGPRKRKEIRTRDDFIRDVVSWAVPGRVGTVIPFAGSVLFQSHLAARTFEFTVRQNHFTLQVVKELGC